MRGHVAAGRTIKAWLLTGATGTGKTTTAKILSVSLQCEHQTVFGNPCKECRSNRSNFDIYEISCAKITGIRELEAALDGVDNWPRVGRYRIYILDEVQKASDSAQSLILKMLEDSPETTIFILCTTQPYKVLETIQGRCVLYRLKELEMDDITILVKRLLKKVGSKKPADRLVYALVERGVTYPRHIAQAVEKYIAGGDAQEAAEVQGSEPIDVRALGRSIVKGDWPGVAKYLAGAQLSDIRSIRLSILAYLRKILLDSPDVDDRTAAVAAGISRICELANVEDTVMGAGMASALFNLCQLFSEYRH
jgi:energy-coupling factor transporter ATP-binding protein EcfA2